MNVSHVTVGALQENCYLVADPERATCVVVDPGGDPDRVVSFVERSGTLPEAVWVTHGHVDHVGAIAAVVRKWSVPIFLHPLDRPLYDRAHEVATMYGFADFEQPPKPDVELTDGELLRVGVREFTVHHTPGHSPGHCVFVGRDVMLAGDLLFAGSIGRTDLPLSDGAAMSASLARVAALDPALRVLPGHGPMTTLGHELDTNPFLTGLALPVRR